ncbi:hypothetical protein [Herbidospora yilanensis]|uniref:hypothetical protein n=1 Tax=Herbidospora yilanensis TaxID=354426 RepID=UPI0007803203|nr:hypothetical protein [Herbidospora yilanensis]
MNFPTRAAVPPVMAGLAGPASAHPFGAPPTARMSATGSPSPDETAKGAFSDLAPGFGGVVMPRTRRGSKTA